MNRRIPTLSLFSGAGGLDIGFKQAGFDVLGCVEINKTYCETLSANVSPKTTVHCEDIGTFDTRPYRKAGIECVIGGPPCQTFSAAGRRSGGVIGIEDERGQLFKAYCRVLRELKPKVFLFENVYGLPGASGGAPWRAMLKAFSELGYHLSAEVIDAADYGVPQHRERLILVGYRNGEFSFPMPTHGPDSNEGPPLVSVEDAIRDLQDPAEPFHNNLGGLYGHLLTLVPEGLNYSFFTAEMGYPEPVFAWRSKFHDLLYKVNRSEPCRTIKAQPGKFTGPFHWKNRHFTIDELKRLQTFPDDYKIVGSPGIVLEQIGNSVPPELARILAVSVRQQLITRPARVTYLVRQPGFQSTFRQRQRLKIKKFQDIAREAIAKRYVEDRNTQRRVAETATYFLNPKNVFDRERGLEPILNNQSPSFKVEVADSGSHIQMSFDRLDGPCSEPSTIEIAGLRKYLPDYDRLSLRAHIADVSDIFHAWVAIEEALIARSRFYSLIDIYGHYANRGDTVQIDASWKLSRNSKLLRIINKFGKSLACGEFVSRERLLDDLRISDTDLDSAILKMRGIRFDIRTPLTHPIITSGVLCTYPFPLLSPRALVESRVQLLRLSSSSKGRASGRLVTQNGNAVSTI